MEQYEKSLYTLQCPADPEPHFHLYNDLWTAYVSGFRIHLLDWDMEPTLKMIFIYDSNNVQIKIYDNGSLELMKEVIQRFDKLKAFI